MLAACAAITASASIVAEAHAASAAERHGPGSSDGQAISATTHSATSSWDQRAADARGPRDGRSRGRAGGRPEGGRGRAAEGDGRRVAGGCVDLNDPAVTLALLRLNAVVGVKGTVSETKQLTSVGITCALCHSSVDNSLTPGIGTASMDGPIAISTSARSSRCRRRCPTRSKAEFRTWGPGKYDPRHHAFDGTNIIPLNSPSLPIVIPSIFGLKGVGFETFTADGPISYWNSYVGVGQMGGHGSFSDPRLGLSITQTPDLVTPKLAALLDYQLSLRTPEAAARAASIARPQIVAEPLFAMGRRCVRPATGGRISPTCWRDPRPACHSCTIRPKWGRIRLRRASATGKYRTTPLRALWQHPPYFHDGSAPTLIAVVDHYDQLFALELTRLRRRTWSSI